MSNGTSIHIHHDYDVPHVHASTTQRSITIHDETDPERWYAAHTNIYIHFQTVEQVRELCSNLLAAAIESFDATEPF